MTCIVWEGKECSHAKYGACRPFDVRVAREALLLSGARHSYATVSPSGPQNGGSLQLLPPSLPWWRWLFSYRNYSFVEVLVHQVVKNISHKASIIVTPRRRAARGG